jgi:hypothetical protein
MGLTRTIRATAATFGFVALSALVPAVHAEVLIEQPPGHVGGPGADTAFYNDLGFPSYEITADDFRLPAPARIDRVRVFGFYGGNFSGSPFPPTGNETIRVRVYDDGGSNGLPGAVLFEQSTLNASRVATGQWGCGVCGAMEYQFDIDLHAPFDAQAGGRYWIEVAQINDIDSLLRWEDAPHDGTPFAIMNPYTGGTWQYENFGNLAFQLLGVPEPSYSVLILFGLLCVARKGRGKEARMRKR